MSASLPRVRPRVLLLDAGGTLVFLDGQVVADVLARQGVHVTAEAVRAAEGPAKALYQRLMREGVPHEEGWRRYVADMIARAGAPVERADALVTPLRAEHERFNLWRRLADGAPAALDRLREAGMRLGLVSNSEGVIDALLRRLGIRDRFEVVVDSEVEGVRKPDPEIFRRALARMHAEAATAMYAGDIPDVDVAGARAAGMHAVLIDPYGYFPDYDGAPSFASVAALADALLALPVAAK